MALTAPVSKFLSLNSATTQDASALRRWLCEICSNTDKKQEDIASALNITGQQYQLYESGKREMPMHHFVTLAKYYNISLDYLSGLVDAPRKLA